MYSNPYSKWIAISIYMGLALLLIGVLMLMYVAAINNLIPNSTQNSDIFSYVGIIFIIISSLELPIAIGWYLLVKLAEVIINKSASKSPSAAGILYIIGVPILAMILCGIVAYAYSFYTYSVSISKYGANFNTISDTFAYPTNSITLSSGKYTASVIQNDSQKKTKSFSISINNNTNMQTFEDGISYNTNFSFEGEVTWWGNTGELLLVSAKEGDFVYYPTETSWERVNRNAKNFAECDNFKSILKQYKSSVFDGSSLIICPT